MATERTYVPGLGWRLHVPGNDGRWLQGAAQERDAYWTLAIELARVAVETAGELCLACGGYLWSRAGSGRLYCDDTCKNRHQRRRGRYRSYLREAEEPCQFCGSHP